MTDHNTAELRKLVQEQSRQIDHLKLLLEVRENSTDENEPTLNSVLATNSSLSGNELLDKIYRSPGSCSLKDWVQFMENYPALQEVIKQCTIDDYSRKQFEKKGIDIHNILEYIVHETDLHERLKRININEFKYQSTFCSKCHCRYFPELSNNHDCVPVHTGELQYDGIELPESNDQEELSGDRWISNENHHCHSPISPPSAHEEAEEFKIPQSGRILYIVRGTPSDHKRYKIEECLLKHSLYQYHDHVIQVNDGLKRDDSTYDAVEDEIIIQKALHKFRHLVSNNAQVIILDGIFFKARPLKQFVQEAIQHNYGVRVIETGLKMKQWWYSDSLCGNYIQKLLNWH